MIKNNVNICGITPKHCFPECFPHFFTQFCETDKLNIVGKDPDIQELVEVSLTIVIRNFRILCTPVGKKLIVHAVKNIEIIFKNCGIKYVSRFCIPFCSLLDDIDEKVTEVNCIVEDIDVFQVSARCVAVSALLLVVPDFKSRNDEWHDPNTIRCDIKLKGC